MDCAPFSRYSLEMDTLHNALIDHDEWAKSIDEYYLTQQQVSFTPAEEARIIAVEEALGIKYPPSFRNFVLQHGLFCVGESGTSEQLELWNFPVGEMTVLSLLMRDHGAENADELAQKMDESGDLSILQNAVVLAIKGDEDYLVFDLRSADKDNECKVLQLELHSDVQYFLNMSDYSKCLGFEEFLIKELKNRRTELEEDL